MMDPRIDPVYLEEAAKGTRWLVEKGFTPSGDSGDVSVRDPKTGLIYISASMKSKPFVYHALSEYRAQDMAVLTPEGESLTPWSTATIEAPMHLAIYAARPDVNAIVHTHALWSSVFAINHMDIPFVLAEQYINLGMEIRCAKYAAAGEDEMGTYVVEALGSNNAAIMANHGAVTVGGELETAYRRAYFLENIAQKAIFAKLNGPICEVPKDHILAEYLM